MRTRFAPTASGYLHLGNAVNIVVIRRLAALWDCDVALRIDDFDSSRARREYVRDIFDVCTWLELTWDLGPKSRLEYESRDRNMRDVGMKADLLRAVNLGMPVYACDCSRLSRSGTGSCLCRERELPWVPGSNTLRVRVPDGLRVQVGTQQVDLAADLGDFVVWRRDDLPAYQLASVILDRDLGTDLLIRGEDLRESSAAQLYICEWLGFPEFREARMVHHPLIVDEFGHKLSKSAGIRGVPLDRSNAVRDQVELLAEDQMLQVLRTATW